jgi:hypothetical protein
VQPNNDFKKNRKIYKYLTLMCIDMKITKNERRIWKNWQFFDRYGFFPYEKKRIDITISGYAFEKLQKVENKSEFIDRLIMGK